MNEIEARQALNQFKVIKHIDTGNVYVKTIAGFKGGLGMQVAPVEGCMEMHDYKTYELPVGTYIEHSIASNNPQIALFGNYNSTNDKEGIILMKSTPIVVRVPIPELTTYPTVNTLDELKQQVDALVTSGRGSYKSIVGMVINDNDKTVSINELPTV
jgi:hypothetical protein